jgi:hypothetical protein
VVDEELAAPGEEIGERLLAIRAFEGIALLDPQPGQLASRSRVSAFSRAISSRRAASHSDFETPRFTMASA